MPANAQIYRDALKTYRAAFFAGMGENTEGWRDLVYEIGMDATEEDILLFLSMDPDLPKFRDRRQYFDLVFHKLAIETDEFKKGFKVKEADFRKDKWGVYARAAREMGRHVALAMIRMVWDMLLSGFSGTKGLAYDGQFLFDSDHVTDTGVVQSNVWALDFSPTNYDTVYQRLEEMRLPNGELAFTGDMSTRCYVGPKYRSTAKQMFDLLQDGNNPRYQQSDYRIIPYLSGAYEEYWFLQAIPPDEESRPVVFKEEVPVEFVEQSAPDSDAVFEFGERRYGVNADFGMAYGRYEVIQGSTGAA